MLTRPRRHSFSGIGATDIKGAGLLAEVGGVRPEKKQPAPDVPSAASAVVQARVAQRNDVTCLR